MRRWRTKDRKNLHDDKSKEVEVGDSVVKTVSDAARVGRMYLPAKLLEEIPWYERNDCVLCGRVIKHVV